MENSAPSGGETRATGASDEVFVPLDASTKRTLRLCLGVIALGIYWLIWRFGLRGAWGPWSMRTQLAEAAMPAFFLLPWVPMVWAALRWTLRDFIGARRPPSAGKHALEPRPLYALFCLLMSVGILLGVALPTWDGYGATLQDWWEGATRHEGVACQEQLEGDDESRSQRNRRPRVVFDLTGSDGYSQHFEFNRRDLEDEADREGSPYSVILEACDSQGVVLGLSVYPRTGIVNEAWKTN